ncbi:MAG: TIGR01777 family oxidoreductase [Polyangiaceae bacterium]
MSTMLVTGATGLIGSRALDRWPDAKALARTPAKVAQKHPRVVTLPWETHEAVPSGAMDGVSVVLHLAGEPVAGPRWTEARKATILDSRVLGTRNIVNAIGSAKERPQLLVCASAVGYYGPRGDEVLTEESARGEGFLADVCVAWEREALAAEELGVRVVCLRIGIVLAPKGGALDAMLPLFRKGLGGPLGNGKQWMPWVHIDDVLGMIAFAIEREALRGPLNVTAPSPVTNRDFTKALGEALHRPAVVPAPLFGLKLVLGEFADTVVASQRAVPERAAKEGYAFIHTDLSAALRDVVDAAKGA